MVRTKSRLPFCPPSIQISIEPSDGVEVVLAKGFLTVRSEVQIDSSEDAED